MNNPNALATGIAIEAPPASLPIEAQDYLHRVMIQISGQFNNMDKEIERLKQRVKVLEGP
jgi:hypothetical protein